MNGLPAFLLQNCCAGHNFAFKLYFAQANQRQAEVGKRHEVAGCAQRSLHINNGVDVVVEEVDESLYGVEFAA